jgi:hypothetical protein
VKLQVRTTWRVRTVEGDCPHHCAEVRNSDRSPAQAGWSVAQPFALLLRAKLADVCLCWYLGNVLLAIVSIWLFDWYARRSSLTGL